MTREGIELTDCQIAVMEHKASDDEAVVKLKPCIRVILAIRTRST